MCFAGTFLVLSNLTLGHLHQAATNFSSTELQSVLGGIAANSLAQIFLSARWLPANLLHRFQGRGLLLTQLPAFKGSLHPSQAYLTKFEQHKPQLAGTSTPHCIELS